MAAVTETEQGKPVAEDMYPLQGCWQYRGGVVEGSDVWRNLHVGGGYQKRGISSLDRWMEVGVLLTRAGGVGVSLLERLGGEDSYWQQSKGYAIKYDGGFPKLLQYSINSKNMSSFREGTLRTDPTTHIFDSL